MIWIVCQCYRGWEREREGGRERERERERERGPWIALLI